MQSIEQKLSSLARDDYQRVKSHLEEIGSPFFESQTGKRVNETRILDVTKQVSDYLGDDSKSYGSRFYLKLEYDNPLTHSVKGRAVASMVLEAIETGALYTSTGQRKKWIEPTSGNTGKGLAELANLLGVEFTAVFSRLDVSQAIKDELLKYGARMITIGSEYTLDDLESLAKKQNKTVSYYWANFGGANEDTEKFMSKKVADARGESLTSALKEIEGTLLLDKLLPLAIEASVTPIMSRVKHGEFGNLIDELRGNIPELDDASKIVGFVCPEGNTSMLVSTLLNQLGFTNVSNIKGGVKSLRSEEGKISVSSEYCPVPGTSITKSSIDFVKKLVSDNPQEYFTFMQYENAENFYAHYKTTGPELERQVEHLDYIVCTFGTGGTATGIAKYFSEKKVVVAFPDKPVEGIRTRGGVEGLAFYKPELYSRTVEIDTGKSEDLLEYFVKEGLHIGPSTAVGLVAAVEMAKAERGKVFAVIASDSLDNYEAEYNHLL